MINAIITIIVGLVVAFILPEWIRFGSKSSRSFIQLVFNVTGILIAISGGIKLLHVLGSL